MQYANCTCRMLNRTVPVLIGVQPVLTVLVEHPPAVMSLCGMETETCKKATSICDRLAKSWWKCCILQPTLQSECTKPVMYHCFLYHVLENVWNTSGDAIACWTSTLVTESKHTSVVWCRCRLVKVDIQSLWGTFRTLTSLCATLTTLADRLSAFERLCRTLSALARAYKHWKFGKRTECLTAFARCRRKLMELPTLEEALWKLTVPSRACAGR